MFFSVVKEVNREKQTTELQALQHNTALHYQRPTRPQQEPSKSNNTVTLSVFSFNNELFLQN